MKMDKSGFIKCVGMQMNVHADEQKWIVPVLPIVCESGANGGNCTVTFSSITRNSKVSLLK
jgi:hypothetical protein